MTYIPEIHWGLGTDGDVTISTDTDLSGSTKQYNNLTIDPGVKLYDSTGVLRIYVRGRLTINGSIDQTSQGGAGGAGGTPSTYQGNQDWNGNATNPGAGDTGGLSQSSLSSGNGAVLSNVSDGGAGTPGTSQVPDATGAIPVYISELNLLQTSGTFAGFATPYSGGGPGGGAGGCVSFDRGGFGGTGGTGGGIIFVSAKSTVGSGTVTAAGGDGVTPNPAAGGGAGGGCGGNGGLIILYSRYIDPSITFDASGGAGGAGGISTGGNGTGGTGDNGLDGVVIKDEWKRT